MKIRPRRLPVKRNPMARELAQTKYRQRVVPARKGAGSYVRTGRREDIAAG
jgi:stalled ribosome alternative rescue factor ArfA